MSRFITPLCAALALAASVCTSPCLAKEPRTWTADNGNGTYTNPIFYDEFSDPDIIKVGDEFYLTGTTMHTMPGLPILRSKDLVNWHFVAYASPKLDLAPAFRLEDGKNVYGRGIWAPSFRYHKGKFYIFSNVNGYTTQLFTATDPAGPWTQTAMKRSFHDLSVLFDDDGKAYVIWGYDEVKLAQLNEDLSDIVPGSERVIIKKGSGMGEGSHFYKIDGKYFIISAWYNDRMRMPAARADRPEGPYEVNPAISIDEDFGLHEGYRLANNKVPPFTVQPPNKAPNGRVSLHQGGVVQTPLGEWWGFSMMDYNSVGRLVNLSPVTWNDGWPYFGLPGNLGRTPRTWVKPKTAAPTQPHAPYQRSDGFSGAALQPLWQWNHVPDNSRWSLTERPGSLRLHSLPAKNLWEAKNTLTQRAIGPDSSATAVLDLKGLQPGDVAGLALFGRPYSWLGVEQTADGRQVVLFDEQTGEHSRVPLKAERVWLRVDGDFISERAKFSYSVDGKSFAPIGQERAMVFQLLTFQGMRYGLFNFNTAGAAGGFADFDAIDIHEPHPAGLMRPIPFGKQIQLTDAPSTILSGAFAVRDMKLGRVALSRNGQFLTVDKDARLTLQSGQPGPAQSLQWIETPNGDLVLMSLVTHRFIRIDPKTGAITADSPGPNSGGSDGSRFVWKLK
ncbi:glycoside hydrolase family 43 protein [Pseudoduganella aquatica]|uniref:Family 43 glycosylhydrolase n=1 Tax=Pseudoduganella aquatica TaxID=2660641 RepID=A0A7X4HDR0_9BURK|nr:glycoside hydrolase 43 family protein [Pseudoduganella aquatica]MYN09329.1 family 43 glycosylhydrolase [Pseudoduganella aquatica]